MLIATITSAVAATLAKTANDVAEQARQDAANAPAEHDRRQLYHQIDNAISPLIDAVHRAWPAIENPPIGPVPDFFDTNLAELHRLHDKLPSSTLH